MRTRIAIMIAVVVLSTEAIIAGTVLGVRWMNVTLKRPASVTVHRVDTVWFFHNDTVVTRARDTVQVVITKAGRLTEAHLVSMMCNKKYDPQDKFWYNPMLGFIICPNQRASNN